MLKKSTVLVLTGRQNTRNGCLSGTSMNSVWLFLLMCTESWLCTKYQQHRRLVKLLCLTPWELHDKIPWKKHNFNNTPDNIWKQISVQDLVEATDTEYSSINIPDKESDKWLILGSAQSSEALKFHQVCHKKSWSSQKLEGYLRKGQMNEQTRPLNTASSTCTAHRLAADHLCTFTDYVPDKHFE